MGFYIRFKKVSQVAMTVRFLGIDINLVTLELTLPRDKLDKTLEYSTAFMEGGRQQRKS